MTEIKEDLKKRRRSNKAKGRSVLFRIIISIAIFIAALIAANQYLMKQQGGQLTVVNQPSYPVMQITNEHGDYNLMPAYESEVDLSLVRNQISAVNSRGEIGVKLYCYNYDITAIQYSLFQGDMENVLEEGTLNQLKKDEEENVCTGNIHLTKNLDPDSSYYLQFSVRLDKETKTYFYTKIQNATEMHLDEYLTFANQFHTDLFDKNNEEKNVTYLEPAVSSTDKSLDTVSIESTVNSMFYGNLDLKEQMTPQIKVKELNKTYAVLELSSVVSVTDKEDTIQYYNVTETFKMRYTAQRMYLLDYRRNMGAVYNGSLIDSNDNNLGIGIQNINNVSFKDSADGHKLCFVEEGQLWYYDCDNAKALKVYSIKSDNFADPHNNVGGTDIKILNMTKNGKITYLIYGYMNRGSYEGKNGIALMTYNPKENYSEEVAFLETTVSYEMMKRDLNICSFLNKKNVFYCLLGGDLHQVSLKEKKDEIIASEIMNETLTVSADGSIIALEQNRELTANRQINLINLQNGKKTEIQCEVDKRIRSIGFILQDFVYAVADNKDVVIRTSGQLRFPAKSLQIVDQEGKAVKEISSNGKYIMKATANGTVIEMVKASRRSGGFKLDSKKEYIRYKNSTEDKRISMKYISSSIYWNQAYFSFPENVYVKVKPKLSDTTLKAATEKNIINLSKSEDSLERYFVYARGELLEDYTTLSEAVRVANQERGNVIDEKEQILWQCAFAEYGKVPDMNDVEKASSDKGSLRACLRMIANLSGQDADQMIVKSKSKSPFNLLEACTGKTVVNLSGTGLDEVLYYVDRGTPVLTKLTATRYVVVMSYNKDKVRYLDPVTGKSTVTDRNQLKNTLKQQGNVFYSYLK